MSPNGSHFVSTKIKTPYGFYLEIFARIIYLKYFGFKVERVSEVSWNENLHGKKFGWLAYIFKLIRIVVLGSNSDWLKNLSNVGYTAFPHKPHYKTDIFECQFEEKRGVSTNDNWIFLIVWYSLVDLWYTSV